MVRVGVTGHMNITPASVALIYDEMVRHFLAAGGPAELVGISCIARGADSVLFDELLRRAHNVRVMDFDDTGADAYEAANDAVLGSCDRLIAVWDGRAGERSGTGSVVASARDRGLPVDIIWPVGATYGSHHRRTWLWMTTSGVPEHEVPRVSGQYGAWTQEPSRFPIAAGSWRCT